jgi:hypothetical protein
VTAAPDAVGAARELQPPALITSFALETVCPRPKPEPFDALPEALPGPLARRGFGPFQHALVTATLVGEDGPLEPDTPPVLPASNSDPQRRRRLRIGLGALVR